MEFCPRSSSDSEPDACERAETTAT